MHLMHKQDNEIAGYLLSSQANITFKFNAVTNSSAKPSCPQIPAKSVSCSKRVKLSVFVCHSDYVSDRMSVSSNISQTDVM